MCSHLKRMLIWSFTDSLEQDTCSNYQKVRYVCKCVLRKTILCKPPFCHSPDPTFTWGRIGTSTLKNHKCDTCRTKADRLGHQPQRIINVTPAWPRQTDRDITLKNHKCDTCRAKADNRDFNLKETKKEYGKESTGLCELLHEAEI